MTKKRQRNVLLVQHLLGWALSLIHIFFTLDGRVTDDLPLRGEIFEELKYCAVNNIPRTISNIIEIMKLAAHVEDFPPEQDRIHLANGTLMPVSYTHLPIPLHWRVKKNT